MIKKRTRLLHRVMAAAFRLPRLPEQTEVDHINGLPWDNRLSNLRCASRSEQMKYSYANPNRGKSGLRRSKPIYGRRVGSTEWVFYRSGRADHFFLRFFNIPTQAQISAQISVTCSVFWDWNRVCQTNSPTSFLLKDRTKPIQRAPPPRRTHFRTRDSSSSSRSSSSCPPSSSSSSSSTTASHNLVASRVVRRISV